MVSASRSLPSHPTSTVVSASRSLPSHPTSTAGSVRRRLTSVAPEARRGTRAEQVTVPWRASVDLLPGGGRDRLTASRRWGRPAPTRRDFGREAVAGNPGGTRADGPYALDRLSRVTPPATARLTDHLTSRASRIDPKSRRSVSVTGRREGRLRPGGPSTADPGTETPAPRPHQPTLRSAPPGATPGAHARFGATPTPGPGGIWPGTTPARTGTRHAPYAEPRIDPEERSPAPPAPTRRAPSPRPQPGTSARRSWALPAAPAHPPLAPPLTPRPHLPKPATRPVNQGADSARPPTQRVAPEPARRAPATPPLRPRSRQPAVDMDSRHRCQAEHVSRRLPGSESRRGIRAPARSPRHRARRLWRRAVDRRRIPARPGPESALTPPPAAESVPGFAARRRPTRPIPHPSSRRCSDHLDGVSALRPLRSRPRPLFGPPSPSGAQPRPPSMRAIPARHVAVTTARCSGVQVARRQPISVAQSRTRPPLAAAGSQPRCPDSESFSHDGPSPIATLA